ncbi:MAG: S16 family serine protease [Bacillota bacterium]|nr:S16 family serine protease [Bacillota bacterium]
MDLLWGVQLLFFGMGAWYFYRSSRKKKGEGLNFEDNMVEMDRLQMMREEGLTLPLSEQTRPQRLEEIIGQEKAIRALRAALCGPNPQHILIYGPPGVGKTAAARLILEEAKGREDSPFRQKAKFVEIDATTLQFDERNIADPLLGSVHDPIYQGAGAFGQAGIPRPRPGAVCEAHGGVLFLDEIGELHPIQMNRLLKVLEDRVARFQSSYYSRGNKAIPPYIHEIFKNGIPADFRLIGATTRSPHEIPEALRSRCTEIFFDRLDRGSMEKIAENSLRRAGLDYETGLCSKIASYANGGRDAVNLVQSLTSLARMEGKTCVTAADLDWAAEAGRYEPVPQQKIPEKPCVGVVNGLGVQAGGGVLLPVEAVVQKGKSGLTVTGIVEEEEIKGRQGCSRRKSNARSAAENVLTLMEQYGFSEKEYAVHLNFPGGVPVDGPSAGVAMFLAVYSAFTEMPISNEIALTGEIGIHGQILPVGGVEEKLEAAREAGAVCAYIPRGNWKTAYEEMKIQVVPVATVQELLEHIFLPESLLEARKLLAEKEIG